MHSSFTEVHIHGLTVDPGSKNPIVLLKEADGNRVVPIWIGVFEANAIAIKLSGVEPPRPMTHDLLYNMVSMTGFNIDRVEITDIRDNTYFARVYLVSEGRKLELDSRPSDALALSVRANSKIYVSEKVFEESSVDIASIQDAEESEDKWTELLRELDPMDFSKYKM